jgi:hypothetical protein
MLDGMYIQEKRTDFSVVIKSRGKPPNPWRWEIYRVGRSTPVVQSSGFFPTVGAAKKAGAQALAELLKKYRERPQTAHGINARVASDSPANCGSSRASRSWKALTFPLCGVAVSSVRWRFLSSASAQMELLAAPDAEIDGEDREN